MHLLVNCFLSQTYTNSGQTSRVQCAPPPKLLNGYQRPVLDIAGGAEMIEFFCKNSYILSGNHRSICLSNGSWSSSLPKCVKGSCFQKHFRVRNTLSHTQSSLFSHFITMWQHTMFLTCIWHSNFTGNLHILMWKKEQM